VLKDFEPVALVSSNPYLVVAKKTMPANDLKGLIAWLKANPDKASAGICVGCPQHVFGVFFQNTTGTRFQLVPYRGSAPATQDMVAGQIDLMIIDPVTAMPQWRAGNIKIYVVLSNTRSAAAPEIPTAEEAGLPSVHVTPWHAMWVPKGTSKAVISKLNAAVVGALADPTVRARLADLGQEIPPSEEQTPEALRALHKADLERWGPIIKAAGIKPE